MVAGLKMPIDIYTGQTINLEQLRLFILDGGCPASVHCSDNITCPAGDFVCDVCAGHEKNHQIVLNYIKKNTIKKLNKGIDNEI